MAAASPLTHPLSVVERCLQLSSLPPDLVVRICFALDLTHLGSLTRTCKALRDALNADELWRVKLETIGFNIAKSAPKRAMRSLTTLEDMHWERILPSATTRTPPAAKHSLAFKCYEGKTVVLFGGKTLLDVCTTACWVASPWLR
eukprot:2487442-Rhodomonas_salina.1